MSIAEKTIALLHALTRDDMERLTPAQRRRFAEVCRHVAALADPGPRIPSSGVLADLRRGHRGH